VSRRAQAPAFPVFPATAAVIGVDMFVPASVRSRSTVPFGDQ
jgi:hypothetical protein